jgi:hypothetical protein
MFTRLFQPKSALTATQQRTVQTAVNYWMDSLSREEVSHDAKWDDDLHRVPHGQLSSGQIDRLMRQTAKVGGRWNLAPEEIQNLRGSLTGLLEQEIQQGKQWINLETQDAPMGLLAQACGRVHLHPDFPHDTHMTIDIGNGIAKVQEKGNEERILFSPDQAVQHTDGASRKTGEAAARG